PGGQPRVMPADAAPQRHRRTAQTVPGRTAHRLADRIQRTGNGSDNADHADVMRLFDVLEDALEPAWRRGASPVMRLEAAIDQLDSDERSRIEESAGRLSVRLLLPTGLCFLPSFIIVGVIPAIASFLL
ncbi:hypothetical protein JS533_010845, partial [Bifidobacterium amazonense]|nr:hypothetical protein [Bifidobacterium amazonense]